MAEDSTVLTPAEQQQVADALEDDAEVMTNTAARRSSSPASPSDVQAEIIRINTDARHRALQVALLIPILAGLARAVQLVPHDAPPGPRAVELPPRAWPWADQVREAADARLRMCCNARPVPGHMQGDPTPPRRRM